MWSSYIAPSAAAALNCRSNISLGDCNAPSASIRFRERGVSCSRLPMHKPYSVPNDEIEISQIHLVTGFIEAECVANW